MNKCDRAEQTLLKEPVLRWIVTVEVIIIVIIWIRIMPHCDGLFECFQEDSKGTEGKCLKVDREGDRIVLINPFKERNFGFLVGITLF